MEDGKYDIADAGFTVSIASLFGKEKSEAAIETHKKFIDIQFPLLGVEKIGWKPGDQLLGFLTYVNTVSQSLQSGCNHIYRIFVIHLYITKQVIRSMKDLETIILPVLEMSCAVCANNVENTVKGLPGVEEASVNFAANTLSVKYHPSLITPQKMREAVQEAGYDLVVEVEDPVTAGRMHKHHSQQGQRNGKYPRPDRIPA